jgi:hypothetical protein
MDLKKLIEFENNLLQIRLLTGMSAPEAKEIVKKLNKWASGKTFSTEQAINLYKQDIAFHGKPNMTVEAFVE